MLRRKIAFPLAVFAATVGVMALQKPLFMAWYAGEAAATGAAIGTPGSTNATATPLPPGQPRRTLFPR